MKHFMRVMRGLWLACVLLMAAGMCSAQKVAITFDDLPLNGDLPPGMTRVDVTRNTLAVLQKRHVPAAYGFVNAKKLEGNPDAAEALKLWAAAEPVGNHTYAHMDLNENPPEAFEREIEENEPALELLAAKDANWHWLRYPYLREGDTVEKRRAVRAYLQAHGYRVAQVTLDWEDYMWNSAYARCVAKKMRLRWRGCGGAIWIPQRSIWIWGGRWRSWCMGMTLIMCCCCI